MKSIKYIFVVTAILAAIGTTYWYFSSYKPKSRATEYIAKLLLDPESAQFRGVRIVKGRTVCGEVNGKNLLGAYTGFKPFVYGYGEGFIGNVPNAPTMSGDVFLDALSRAQADLLAKSTEDCNQL